MFAAIGVVAVAIVLFFVFRETKGNHLELKGEILKVRTGAIDDNNCAAVLDFRLTNPSDVPFVVRMVKVIAVEPGGEQLDGDLISKTDFKQLLDYNRFLGEQYNPGFSIKDKIAPHETADRMVAVRFEVPQSKLENASQIKMWVQDVDGPEFETAKSMHEVSKPARP